MENKIPDQIAKIWEEDKLGRVNEAIHLNRFLENKFSAEKNKPFVMNLDSGWGHGKTFFITHFAEQLRLSEHPVVIFDAWKNDFSDEALLSFISCICLSLKDELKGKQRAIKQVDKLFDLAKSFVKPALPILLAALVKHLTGTSVDKILAHDESSGDYQIADNITDLSENLTNLATSKALEIYNEKKSATENFTNTITNLVSIVENLRNKHLPIYIFVDELDRCRPLFSIELLESIKHLFSTSGVYFIVSTDTEQLCHSIRAIYGSGFNARRYLKRFFDTEYQLETPNSEEFSNYLFSSVTLSESKIFVPNITFKERPKLSVLFGHICDFFKLGARDMQQVFETVKTSVYISEKKVHFVYLMLVACMHHKYPEKLNLVLSPVYIDLEKFKDFMTENIKGKTISEPETDYRYMNGSQEATHKLSILKLFEIYISCIDRKLDLKNTTSSIELDIVEQLILDNRIPDKPQIRANRDLTLGKYLDLVLRAGKFHSFKI